MAFALLIFLAFIGLIGTLVPAFPGTGLIFIAALVYAAISGFAILGIKALIVLFLFALIGIGGASRYGVMGAIIGFFLGLLFIPVPGGALFGAFAGAFCFEMGFALKSERESFRAGIGAVLGALASYFFEFFVGLAMVIYIFYLLWPQLQIPADSHSIEVFRHHLPLLAVFLS